MYQCVQVEVLGNHVVVVTGASGGERQREGERNPSVYTVPENIVFVASHWYSQNMNKVMVYNFHKHSK